MQGSNDRGSKKLGCLSCVLSLFLLLIVAGATMAFADDPEDQPPPVPTPVEMQEGLNADNSAIYEAELTDPQAAEELPHEDLDREQALELMQAVFDPLLQAPAGIFDELDVQKFLSSNAAIIAPGDQPEPTGATIGAPPEDRYEGTTLLESTTPLRTDSGSGQGEVVDLGLEQAEGEVQPSNPLVEVSIPQQLGEGIELPESGIQVKLEGAPSERSPSTLGQSVAAFPEVAQDTSLAVAPTPTGFETLTFLQSSNAPTTQTFNLDLPDGANLKAARGGGAEVVRGEEALLGISAPVALDASGDEVPVSLTVSGNAVTLDISPGPSTTFPIMVDPLYETYNWWNGITGLGGWHAYTTATPNYYFADHATCTTNASPYACQSGVTANAPGLYIGELPGAVPINSQVNWQFEVPRWQEEWANNKRAPDSYITSMLLEHIGFWHRTDSAPSPTLWMGIWNTQTPGWVAGYAQGGNSPDINGNGVLPFSAGQNIFGKSASFSLSNTDGHNLSAFRDAFVSTAITTIADPEPPSFGLPAGPAKWLNQTPTGAISATVSDTGLGVYTLYAAPPNMSVSPPWTKYDNSCTGTTVYPCSGTKTFNPTYNPAVMPQGINYVSLYAEDPLGNKSSTVKAPVKVDHSAPVVAPLSGTLTEQAKLGTSASQYTLKYSAADGDHAAATPLAPFGSEGTGEGKTQRPMGAAIDASGNIWVADRDNNRIEKFDENGKFLMQFGKLGSGNGEFNDPRGIAISSSGTVWVTEVGNKRVQAFDSEGKFLRKIISTSSNTSFSEPYGVATGPEGVLWVSDAAAQSLYKFREADGTFLGKATGSASNPSGGGPTDLSAPVGVATDAKGNVWVVENGNHRVQKFDSNGKYVLQFGGTMGSGNGQLKFPVGVAVAPSGNVLVVDSGNNRVQEFQPNGVYLRQFGATGSGNGQFSEPRGIAVNSAGTAFVADASNHRIAKWSHADLNRQSGVVSTEVKVDGTLVEPKYAPGCATEDCSITKEWTLSAKNYGSGLHIVQVTATDGVGLSTTKSLVITTVKDTTGPQLTANSPFFTAPEGWLEQKNYSYTASASDAGGYGVQSLNLKIDGQSVKNWSGSCPTGGCSGSFSGTINMATYKGGAHPAEVIAADVGGNTTTKKWTINVDPKGAVSTTEAIDTLEAAEETAEAATVAATNQVLDPEEIAAGLNPALVVDGSDIESTGTPNTTSLTTDASDGLHIEAPGPDLTVTPLADPTLDQTAIAEGVAAVQANAGESVDTIIRPEYNGALVYSAIREVASPEEYSWSLNLVGGETLILASDQYAEVKYEDGTTAVLIHAPPAVDATGKAVQTSLSVDGNILTLYVHHRSGTVTYPVIAGHSFEMGYESATLYIPPEPGGEPEEEGFEPAPPPGSNPKDHPRFYARLSLPKEQWIAPAPTYDRVADTALQAWSVRDCSGEEDEPCKFWEVPLSGLVRKRWFIKQAWTMERVYNPPGKCEMHLKTGALGFRYIPNGGLEGSDWIGPSEVANGSGEHLTAYCHYWLETWPIVVGEIQLDPEVHCRAIQAWIWGNGWVTKYSRKWEPPVQTFPMCSIQS